jgi:vacuolar-type H+-ATPase subunit D/Vma8
MSYELYKEKQDELMKDLEGIESKIEYSRTNLVSLYKDILNSIPDLL